MNASPWLPVETDIKSVLEQYAFPLKALADGTVPALIFRKAFNPAHCAGLIDRFYERGLLYDPRQNGVSNTTRVDIGTSLGRHSRSDPEIFFAHARETRALFETLFDGYTDPVRFIYRTLNSLAPGKQVMTARESADKLYGPAIFRTYYEGSGHTPHYDSVRKRSRLLIIPYRDSTGNLLRSFVSRMPSRMMNTVRPSFIVGSGHRTYKINCLILKRMPPSRASNEFVLNWRRGIFMCSAQRRFMKSPRLEATSLVSSLPPSLPCPTMMMRFMFGRRSREATKLRNNAFDS